MSFEPVGFYSHMENSVSKELCFYLHRGGKTAFKFLFNLLFSCNCKDLDSSSEDKKNADADVIL